MDIADLVKYEQLFPLELVDPITDEKLGIVLQIRSAGSAEARQILRKHNDENMAFPQKRKSISSATFERQEAEKAASYIASWDWGEHGFHGEKPDCTMDNAVNVIQEISWVYLQVTEAATSIQNFSQTSVKASVKQSG